MPYPPPPPSSHILKLTDQRLLFITIGSSVVTTPSESEREEAMDL